MKSEQVGMRENEFFSAILRVWLWRKVSLAKLSRYTVALHCSDTIEIREGIIFDFYTGLPHMVATHHIHETAVALEPVVV